MNDPHKEVYIELFLLKGKKKNEEWIAENPLS